MRLHLVWPGKTRNRHCAALQTDYLQRIERFATADISEIKDQSGAGSDDRIIAAESPKLIAAVERDDYVILLDEIGRQMSSAELATLIDQRRQQGCKRMAFIIGGFAGVSAEVKQRADLVLSLSRLTLTHEMARVILTEQIYRAFTLIEGFPYHRA